MSFKKHFFTILAAITALALVASAALPFIAGKPGVYAGAGLGLAGLICLAILVIYWFRLTAAMDSAIVMLKKSHVKDVKVSKSHVITPLIDAVSEFIDNSASKGNDLDKQACEFNLQIQLLKREKQSIEATIFSIKDAVIVTDAFDRLTLANDAAGELFGFDPSECVLQEVETILGNDEFAQMILRSRSSKLKHVKHEVSIERDGEVRTFDCIISCVADSKGEISGVVAVLHDITREKEISQMKNDFVSHVSHELKTPLASINAYAEMLVDGEAQDEETINQFCSIIQSQAQRLNRLIEEILNISRIESGLIKVNKEHLSLTILVQESAEMLASYAAEKDMTISVPAPIIFDQVDADKDMLSQVIINLLSNAVKYTPVAGSITVESQVNEADGFVTITVTDTGFGIPADDVEHVFDKFYRVEANKKYAKGTGLGLNLVKQIVEKVHGGRVFVTSKVGEGSTFGFDMPLVAKQFSETA